MKKFLVFIFLLFFVAAGFLIINPVGAADNPAGQDDIFNNLNTAAGPLSGGTDLMNLIGNIIRVFLGILGVVAVCYIIYGGYLWLTAQGNDSQVTKAKGIIKNALIGVVVIFASWAIAEFVISRMAEATTGEQGGASVNTGTEWND